MSSDKGKESGERSSSIPATVMTQPSRYEFQKCRDWNTFGQYLKNQRPPVALSQCNFNHVLDFLRYLDQFGKTKVHLQGCGFFGQPEPPGHCTCPLRQAWGSLGALIGRLRAAYEEKEGLPETNPFASRAIRLYLREVRDSQAKARGIPYKKKKDDLRVPYGRGEKPDSEKSVDVSSKERLMSKSFLPQKNKLKAVKENKLEAVKKNKVSDNKASVKVYTRRVGQEVFWDNKLQRHRTCKELEIDPEIRREFMEYKIFPGKSMIPERCRVNSESCWDSMELKHRATTLEELGMDPQNKGIISDFLGFVRAKELCKESSKERRNLLLSDPPGIDRSSIISAMANYLQFDIYHLDLTSLSSFAELEYTLLSTRNRSVIAIEGLFHCAGMLFKHIPDKFAVKHLMYKIDALFMKRNGERILVFTTNHRDQHDAASLRPLGMDIYIHTSSPQPIALPDGGERTSNNSLLLSNSEKENTREASDSTKRYLLPNFDATENKAVKVYSKRVRDCLHSMELERPLTFAELGNDPENDGIISDMLSFVRDKELYKRIGKTWKRGYLLCDSPGTDRSSLIAAVANYLELDVYDLDLRDFSSIKELKRAVPPRNRSLLAIKNFDHWFGMHPNLKNEILSLRNENESASSSHWPISLPDGRHIVVLDPLEQSTKNIAHAVWVDQCSPTMSLPEKKMVRKMLKRKCRTMSGIMEIHQQHFGRRCEGSAKSFRAMHIGRKHGTNRISIVKRIHKQHGIHQWSFRQKWATRKGYSAGDKRSFEVSSLSMTKKLDSRFQFIHMSQCAKADESGPTVPNSEKGSMREALKRDSLKDLRQHFGARRKDAAKGARRKHFDSLAWKSFEVLDSLPLAEQSKSIRNLAWRRTLTHKHCVRLKKSKDLPRSLLSDCSGELAAQSTIGLTDGEHIPSLSEKKIVRKTLKRKCRNMSILRSEEHQQHVGRRWEDDAKFLGVKRICRQLVIHREFTVKRIHWQHGICRLPFKQNWATMKGYPLGDGRPAEVISLSMDGKLVSRLQIIHISWLGRFSPRPLAVPGGESAGPIALSASEFVGANNRADRIGQDQSGSTSSHSKKKRTREQEDHREINKSITLNDLQQHYGRKREDASESLGVSVSTLKRICRQHGIKRWPYEPRNKAVKKPPDKHGGMNTSETCKTLSTNGSNPASSQPMPTMSHTGGSSEDQRNLLASQEEPFLQGHVSRPINRTISSCTDPTPSQPVPTVPHTTGSLEDQRNLLALLGQPLPSQLMPTIPPTMDGLEHWNHLSAFLDDPIPEGHAFGSIDCTFPSCCDPAPSQPMPTIAHTMPTIPLMMPLLTERQDTGSMKLKATYGDTTIKLRLPPLFGISELKEEVSKRRESGLGSYKIEYKDVDGIWTWIACNDDIRDYLEFLPSLGNQVIQLRVRDSPNTPICCQFCGSLNG